MLEGEDGLFYPKLENHEVISVRGQSSVRGVTSLLSYLGPLQMELTGQM